jgi:hypothetical protein
MCALDRCADRLGRLNKLDLSLVLRLRPLISV